MKKKTILVVGITGLMGSGKSFCSNIFSMLGANVYNTDMVSKAVQVKIQELREKIVAKFGEQYYNGIQMNKEYAKSLFFGGTPETAENLKWITNTVAPYVMENLNNYKKNLEDYGQPGYILIESAILFETGLDKHCDLIVCVKSPNPIMATYNRDYISKEEWEFRMSTQLPETEKRFDYVIGNDYTKAVEARVNEVHEEIIKNYHSS